MKAGTPRAAAVGVARRLRAAGHRALLAGGCVRDRLLGIEPSDHDVATSARPEEVKAVFPRTVALGERFGCVQVHPGDGAAVEVTTFRTDAGYSDGRRPDHVAFGTDPREDALRRDFTVNALFEDPDTGEVLDFVDGRADMERRVVRAVGDPHRRFGEDRLRLLRAVRFAARLGWAIEPATMAAIRAHAPAVAGVAAERVRVEIERLLTEGGSARGLDLLRESGLLLAILPEVAAGIGVPQPPDFHPEGDVYVHTRLLLAGIDLLPPPRDPVLAFAALLHDVGKPPTFRVADRIRFDAHDAVGASMAEEICRRLRFSRADTEAVAALVRAHMGFRNLPLMREARLRRFLEDPLFPRHLELHRLDCLASHGGLDLHAFCLAARARMAAAPPPPPRLLSGHDLAAMGYLPGPLFGRILAAVEDATLDGTLATPGEARAFVLARFPLAGETVPAGGDPAGSDAGRGEGP